MCPARSVSKACDVFEAESARDAAPLDVVLGDAMSLDATAKLNRVLGAPQHAVRSAHILRFAVRQQPRLP